VLAKRSKTNLAGSSSTSFKTAEMTETNSNNSANSTLKTKKRKSDAIEDELVVPQAYVESKQQREGNQAQQEVIFKDKKANKNKNKKMKKE
jgi:hypothetical protein